ncbi:hypothetical protein EV193_106211 [Herbihabitans rhizosphaerae]|uniref:Uncharacterized protein n=2 Tax=Herbihabitans rhizosphaerae TaxID=1872711 RepID=A0A4Q7KL65_9PSEU|nr:hypothetical protein EV193_106211 [Herbihabitans rhizosphaerae]
MTQAREIAIQAGLTVTETEIHEPGEPPKQPPPPRTGAASGTTMREYKEDIAAQQGYQTAIADYHKKVRAYAEATLTVAQGRDIESKSQDVLFSYLGNVAEKWHINAADFGAGLTGAALAKQHEFKASRGAQFGKYAQEAIDYATDQGKIAANATLPANVRARAILGKSEALAKAHTAAHRVEAEMAGKWLTKLPESIQKNVLGSLAGLGDLESRRSGLYRVPGLDKAVPVLRNVQVAGLVATGFSIGYDLVRGKPLGTNLASNVGGFTAGAVVGFGVGGPLGAVAGFVMSTGTGWMIEQLMSNDVKAVVDLMHKPEVRDSLPWYMRPLW